MSSRAEQESPIRLSNDDLPPDPTRPPPRRGPWIALAVVVVLVAAALASWGIFEVDRGARAAIPVHATNVGGPNTGLVAAGSGPVQVELYLGFQCAACLLYEAAAAPLLNGLAADNRITLTWHVLGGSGAAPGGYPTHVAASAACASDLGRLEAYGEALLAAQPAGGPELTDDQLVDIGGRAGLINPAFAACVRSGRYQGWVGQATATATRRGVTTPPAIWVGGRSLGQPSEATIAAAVTAAGR